MRKEGNEGLVTALTEVFALLLVQDKRLDLPKVFDWSLYFLVWY